MFSIIRCIGYVPLHNYIMKSSYDSVKPFLYHFNVSLYSWISRTNRIPKPTKCVSKIRYPSQRYDAFLVLDFEASFAKGFTLTEHKEIIEFPCAWVDSKTMEIVSVFHKFIKPVVHTILDQKCIELTGISEDMLADEKVFTEVLKDFEQWYGETKQLTKSEKTVFITFGNWDLKVMMPQQCRLSNVTMPIYMKEWIDIRCSLTEVTGKFPKSLKEAIKLVEVERVGRHHSGIDDTINTVLILKRLAESGHVFHK